MSKDVTSSGWLQRAKWYRGALCSHPLPALTNDWTRGAAWQTYLVNHTKSHPVSETLCWLFYSRCRCTTFPPLTSLTTPTSWWACWEFVVSWRRGRGCCCCCCCCLSRCRRRRKRATTTSAIAASGTTTTPAMSAATVSADTTPPPRIGSITHISTIYRSIVHKIHYWSETRSRGAVLDTTCNY